MSYRKISVVVFLVGILLTPVTYSLNADEAKMVPSWDLVGRLIKLAGGGDQMRQEMMMLLDELYARADAGRTDAMYARAWYLFQLKKIANKISGESGGLCPGVLNEAKIVATNEKIKLLWESTEAMKLIGEMYETGVCAEKSKYMAADWYIRAGNQLFENNSRDAALRSMEKALDLVPDHPRAMKLRDTLLR